MTWASTPHSTLDDKVQSRIDAHLDAVEKVLMRDGATRSERRAITDELETQVRDMLATQVNGGTLKHSDIDDVLQKLDPPSAYRKGQGEGMKLPAVDRFSSYVWPMNPAWPLGLCAIGWATILLGVIMSGSANTGGAIAFNLLGLVFGFIYRKEDLGRQGMIACGVSAFLLMFAG